MPLTYTGRLVKPGGSEYPSLTDIAVSLSRQPRFAGHCRRWWSVLDHSLFCDELVKREDFGDKINHARLAMLLHDAHESVTADVPTDMKGQELRAAQASLDLNIMDAFFPGGWSEYWGWNGVVKQIDRRALCAEARVVGPQMSPGRALELFGTCDETVNDSWLLKFMLGEYPAEAGLPWAGKPPKVYTPEGHPAVKEYLSRITLLL
jgi:hypothetical protein